MKYAFRPKKTIRFKSIKKLKNILAVFLVSLIAIFGYIIANNVLSDPVTIINSGTYRNVSWSVDSNYALTIGTAGTTETFDNTTSQSSSDWPWYQYRSNLTQVNVQGSVVGQGSLAYMFYYCTKLRTIDLSGLDTLLVTNMTYMFYYCTNLRIVDLSSFVA